MPPALGDAEAIRHLMGEYARSGIILERSIEDIRASLGSFLIAKHDTQVIGIVSRHDYGQKLVEIRSLAVEKEYSGMDIGATLLESMISLIRNEDDMKIFALSYAPGFFKKNGFIEVPKGSLPEKIWKDCISCPDKDNCGETALIYSESRIKER